MTDAAPKTVRLSDGLELPCYTFHTVVVGSGAAGLNCVERLVDSGVDDVALVTSRLGGGTSANSGSDKQTYYKMGVFGDVADSPMEFARTLVAGGMMHGDLAYIEALLSLPSFFHQVSNGVQFPHNRYGAFVGYKTDHDPRQRATSAGPRTSMQMVQCSLAQVKKRNVPILDRLQVVHLITAGGKDADEVVGLVAMAVDRVDPAGYGLVLIRCRNVVWATGGPGKLFRDSVYPPAQNGSMGVALAAGAVANNLTESQFGLASTRFRWNLSGTYQQVVPHYVSVDARNDRHDVLNGYFDTTVQKGTAVFLKGYQWPFHAPRLQNMGSSLVDLAVAAQRAAGRSVFMDFTRNPDPGPDGTPFDPTRLEPEAADYLRRSGAVQETPLARLAHMNPAAIDIYADHGVDLSDPLEVAVCFQHNNGGLRTSIWWESNLRHFFPIGEAAGTHGVRPGGSALNAGQVGGYRAAARIRHVYGEMPPPSEEDFARLAAKPVDQLLRRIGRILAADESAPSYRDVLRDIQTRMSDKAGFMRSRAGTEEALQEARKLSEEIARKGMTVSQLADLPGALEVDELDLTSRTFLETQAAYIHRAGGSRGSYMVLDDAGDRFVQSRRGKELPHRSENMDLRAEILETEVLPHGDIRVHAVDVRPLPEDDSWYENTWREFREGAVFEEAD